MDDISVLTGSEPTPAAPGSFIRQMLANRAEVASTVPSTAATEDTSAKKLYVLNGNLYYKAFTTVVKYNLQRTVDATDLYSLIDGGANGGMAGADARLILVSDNRKVDVSTADHNNTITNLPIGLFAGKVKTTRSYIVVFLRGYDACSYNDPFLQPDSPFRTLGRRCSDHVGRYAAYQNFLQSHCNILTMERTTLTLLALLTIQPECSQLGLCAARQSQSVLYDSYDSKVRAKTVALTLTTNLIRKLNAKQNENPCVRVAAASLHVTG